MVDASRSLYRCLLVGRFNCEKGSSRVKVMTITCAQFNSNFLNRLYLALQLVI